jgi:hypothetical protein
VLVPTLREALPVVDYLGAYKHELVAMAANVAATTQASERQGAGKDPIHYLRTVVPITAEALVASDRRYGSNRHNPYLAPRALDKLPFGLEAFDCANAAAGAPVPRPGAFRQGRIRRQLPPSWASALSVLAQLR